MAIDAAREEYEQIADFLERHGLLVNAWVIGEVWWALRGDDSGEWSAVVSRRAGELAGVMTLFHGVEPGQERKYDYAVRMEATEGEAVLALLDTLRVGELGCFNTHSPRVQAALDQVPGMERHLGGPFMTTSMGQFRPVAAEGILEITSDDAGLFDGGYQPPWDFEGEKGGRHFAVIRNGKAVASVAWIPLMVEPVFSPPVIRITYVQTESSYRRQGLGQQVSSHVTDLVLRAGARPVYWTSRDNLPSQGLARSLGYEEFARHICYIWRKPSDSAGSHA